MTSNTEITTILGLAFGATVLTFLTGIGMATLADWSIERRMRASAITQKTRRTDNMIRTSEWVSPGHPDKIADYISCYQLDRHLEKDPATRFAVEVMIKDNIVTLGGEIASKADFTDEELAWFVRNAVNEIGYTREYQEKWGKENAVCGDEIVDRIQSRKPRTITHLYTNFLN